MSLLLFTLLLIHSQYVYLCSLFLLSYPDTFLFCSLFLSSFLSLFLSSFPDTFFICSLLLSSCQRFPTPLPMFSHPFQIPRPLFSLSLPAPLLLFFHPFQMILPMFSLHLILIHLSLSLSLFSLPVVLCILSTGFFSHYHPFSFFLTSLHLLSPSHLVPAYLLWFSLSLILSQ